MQRTTVDTLFSALELKTSAVGSICMCALKDMLFKQKSIQVLHTELIGSVVPRSVAYTSMQAEGASVFFHACCSVVGIACRQAGHLGPPAHAGE